MNQTALLQIAERLERLAGRLPSKIRKAVLSELTPLKQLFLQERPPRFLFAGSSAMPLEEIISALFGSDHPTGTHDVPARTSHWLKYRAADVIFFLDDGQVGGAPEKH